MYIAHFEIQSKAKGSSITSFLTEVEIYHIVYHFLLSFIQTINWGGGWEEQFRSPGYLCST